MGIEKKLESTKGKESFVVKSESKRSLRKDRRRKRKMTAIQRLYNICKEVFGNGGPGIVPSAHDINRLTSVLDGVTEVDVGLSPLMPNFRVNTGDRSPIITYIQIYMCDKFSICIFCLPTSAVIPLHNHPGMTVLSKLLFGTMHIKSYDWATDSFSEMEKFEGARLAKVKVDSEFTAPCSTKVLFPADGGNMHCFTALTPCAVLDVLGPPYSDPEERHCTYFYDFPFSHFSGAGESVAEEEQGQYAWLIERENPEELNVVGVRYCGSRIIIN